MNLVKTSVLSATSNIIRIGTSFLTNKLLAIYVGPSGLAFLGQFQNFINIISSFSNAGINSGIIKYVSEYNDQEEKKNKFIGTASFITFFSSLLLSLLIFIFSEKLSVYLLKSSSYTYILKIFSISLIFTAFNSLFLSLINANKEIKKLISLNIISNIFLSIFTALLLFYYKIDGALISYVSSQAIIFFISLFFVFKSNWFKLSNLLKGYDKESGIKLFKFSLMALISTININVSQIFIRDYIIKLLSTEHAGYWQGMIKLSDLYLMFITTTLSIYYLPKLSEIKDNNLLRKEIFNGYKIILPVLAVVNFLIYIFSYYIIQIVFTDKFMPMQILFPFQMIGDFLKISSWLLAFLMIAKAMTKVFIITEVIFSISFVLLSIFFVQNYSLIGLSYAYAFNYLLYTLAMIFIFRKLLFLKTFKN